MSTPHTAGSSLQITGAAVESVEAVLTPAAQEFLLRLARTFESRRRDLLAARRARQERIDAGELPDFLPETERIRSTEWRVAEIPADLQDRRVEITGPVDRKMIINALNSGANVFMADFEDSNSPTWQNNIEGQTNLRDAVRGTITYKSPEGKEYRLAPKPATLFVRPRGWHLTEKHVRVDGEPMSGSLFDFGLFFFHNAAAQLERGTGPYLYLPKLESHLEARLWADVFRFSEDALGIPHGSIRATVLIETILAAFEMHEILWELRDYSAGLNCGRWDYIFSFIKKFRHHADKLLPDRAQVTMDRAFLKAYVDLLIQTCHRRGIHAMGGMAAQIPIKRDPAANEQALDRVRADKLREVRAGHDGTWVAHPGLVGVAKEVFDEHMRTPNQLPVLREEVRASQTSLLEPTPGEITERGLHVNIDVGLQYLEAWLRGNGCVPIYNLMEDAATAEISRAQVWQWTRHEARMTNGNKVTPAVVREAIAEEVDKFRSALGGDGFAASKFSLAAELYEQMMTSDEFPEFMTTGAYDHID
jgi:malate synthase